MYRTIRTGISLGIVSPVSWIMVFSLARLTHLERFHGSRFPVVGKPLDDRKPGTAISAGYKGVLIPAIFGGMKFFQALIANSEIRGQKQIGGSLFPAGNDLKIGIGLIRDLVQGMVYDHREMRSPINELLVKFVDLFRRAVYFHMDSIHRIVDPTF